MEKVYLVTSGDYLDYSIDCVFSTEEKANEYVDANGTKYRVEEYDVDIPFEKTEKCFEVVFSCDKKETISVNIINKDKKDLLYREGQFIAFTVLSDSMKKAVKIASERYGYAKSNILLYPLINVECVRTNSSSKYFYAYYPKYGFYSHEIVLAGNNYSVLEKYKEIARKALDPNTPKEERENALIELKLKPKPKTEPAYKAQIKTIHCDGSFS